MATSFQPRSDLLPRVESEPVLCVRVDRAMGMLGIDKTKLYELIATGELETIRIVRRTFVLRVSIEQFVERLRQKNINERRPFA